MLCLLSAAVRENPTLKSNYKATTALLSHVVAVLFDCETIGKINVKYTTVILNFPN